MMRASRVTTLAIAAAAAAVSFAAFEGPAQALPPAGGGGQTCLCKETVPVYTWIPGYVPGAQTGDMVFKNPTSAGSSVVAQILQGVMGLERTHSGMMIDGANVRHNADSSGALEGDVGLNLPSALWNLTPFGGGVQSIGNVYIAPDVLKAGKPGLHTANLADEADPDGGSEWTGAMELYQPKADPWQTQAARAVNAANALKGLPDYVDTSVYHPQNLDPTNGEGIQITPSYWTYSHLGTGYSLFAYSDYDTAKTRDAASMCSGTLFWAWSKADTTTPNGGFKLNTTYWTSAVRYAKAMELYDIIFDAVMSELAAHGSSLDGDSQVNLAMGIGMQVVNAMAFGRFQDFTANWSPTTMGQGSTVAPDDLVNSIVAGTTAYDPAMQKLVPSRGYTKTTFKTVTIACACP